MFSTDFIFLYICKLPGRYVTIVLKLVFPLCGLSKGPKHKTLVLTLAGSISLGLSLLGKDLRCSVRPDEAAAQERK